ncbi:KH domain-containing protein [Luteolibacter algae]|uniref:KH domain-containing protein n=1 Tax=Luteolibacter algae TaxID=454151 RepID=A0ABW5D8E2_9BACT
MTTYDAHGENVNTISLVLAVDRVLGECDAMQAVTDRLRNFLQFVAVKLIDEPAKAQLKVAELGPKRLRFKLVLAREDVAMLIGRNGFTASAIRSVLKAAADKEGVQVTLQIHSHEEEAEMQARES